MTLLWILLGVVVGMIVCKILDEVEQPTLRQRNRQLWHKLQEREKQLREKERRYQP